MSYYCFPVSNYWAGKCQMVTRRPYCYAGAQLVPGLPDDTPDAMDMETHYYNDRNTMSPETASTKHESPKQEPLQPISLPGVLVSDCRVKREYSYKPTSHVSLSGSLKHTAGITKDQSRRSHFLSCKYKDHRCLSLKKGRQPR